MTRGRAQLGVQEMEMREQMEVPAVEGQVLCRPHPPKWGPSLV